MAPAAGSGSYTGRGPGSAYPACPPARVSLRGTHPRHLSVVTGQFLLLASEEVEWSIRNNREALRTSFPTRARDMLAWLQGDHPVTERGLALIDPTSKRREWLIRSRVDGRRSTSRFPNYAAAARLMSA